MLKRKNVTFSSLFTITFVFVNIYSEVRIQVIEMTGVAFL